MTETFRPSELFALRWSGFDMETRTLMVTQTAYRGKLRDFGKTKKSLCKVHLPEGLANELWLWKQECPDPSPAVNDYMQPIEAGVKQTLDAIYSELTARELAASS